MADSDSELTDTIFASPVQAARDSTDANDLLACDSDFLQSDEDNDALVCDRAEEGFQEELDDLPVAVEEPEDILNLSFDLMEAFSDDFELLQSPTPGVQDVSMDDVLLDSPLPALPILRPEPARRRISISLLTMPYRRVSIPTDDPIVMSRPATRQMIPAELLIMPPPFREEESQPVLSQSEPTQVKEESQAISQAEAVDQNGEKTLIDQLKKGKRSAFLVQFDDSQSDEKRRQAVICALTRLVLSFIVQLAEAFPTPSDSEDSSAEEPTQTQSQPPRRKRKRAQPKHKILPSARLPPLSIEMLDRASAEPGRVKRILFPRRGKGKFKSNGAKELAILVKLIELIIDGLKSNSISTKRDLYYKNVALFGKQVVVDQFGQLVDDLAATLGCRRFDLNIIASSKGLIYGCCSMKLKNGEIADARATTQLISPREMIETIDTDGVDFVLIVEKEAVFQTLRSAEFMQEGGILLTGRGYPDLSTREMVKYLCETLPDEVKVFCLVDGDPHGIDILSTYRFGSSGMAFDNDNLAADRVEWLGVKIDDISASGISRDRLLPLTAADRKKAYAMLQKAHLPDDWKRELQIMVHLNKKAETEIFSSELTDGDAALIDYVTALVMSQVE